MDEEARLRRNAYMREWNARNREKVRATWQAWAEKPGNAERNRRRSREWYEANADQARAREKARYHAEKQLKGYATGDRNWNWKGDDVGYISLHSWVKRNLTKPEACTQCGKAGRLEWANVDGEYRRSLNDWVALCHRCHYHYDVALGQYPPLDPAKAGRASQAARRKRRGLEP